MNCVTSWSCRRPSCPKKAAFVLFSKHLSENNTAKPLKSSVIFSSGIITEKMEFRLIYDLPDMNFTGFSSTDTVNICFPPKTSHTRSGRSAPVSHIIPWQCPVNWKRGDLLVFVLYCACRCICAVENVCVSAHRNVPHEVRNKCHYVTLHDENDVKYVLGRWVVVLLYPTLAASRHPKERIHKMSGIGRTDKFH